MFNNDRCLTLLVECCKEDKECFVSFVRKNYFANAISNTNQVVSTENTNAIANATSNTKEVATPENINQ